MNYEDILYNETDGVATITINRPDRYNAFRGQTCMELLNAFNHAGWNKDIGVIVFTGAGEKPSAPAVTRVPMKASTTAAA